MKKAVILVCCLYFAVSCGKNADKLLSSEEKATEEVEDSSCYDHETSPEVSPNSGQLLFKIDEDVDPCEVEGYVVGKQDLEVESTKDGLYVINDIPAGKHDIIITANSLNVGLKEKSKDRGKRLSLEFEAGAVVEYGVMDLVAMGAVKGVAKLSEKSDHTGIHVYIPGTGFDAYTDSSGSYTIAPYVVPGENNLRFEKDGYHHGQMEAINVGADEIVTVQEVTLFPSTGTAGFILLSGGDDIYDRLTVPLTIGATSDAHLMQISESINFDGSSWRPVKTTYEYTFDTPGDKRLYVRFADANGLASSPYYDDITLDIYMDGGAVVINGGAVETDSRTVSLDITIPKNAIQMMVSSEDSFSAAEWVAVSNTYSFEFPNVGTQTAYVKFTDGNHESSPYTDSIEIDLFPTPATVSIANGAVGINKNTATVSLIHPKNASKVKYSASSDFEGAEWLDLADGVSASLPNQGENAAYVKYKDVSGFESPVYQDSVYVDSVAPTGSFSINSSSLYTANREVTLVVSGDDEARITEMMVSSNEDFSGAAWQDYETSVNHELPSGDGSKYVYLKLKDEYENVSNSISSSISLDTTNPVPDISINDGSLYTDSGNVTIKSNTEDAVSGVTQVQVSEDSSFANSEWQGHASDISFTLSSGDGSKTVYARFKDNVGNVSSIVSATITLDTTNPTVPVISNTSRRVDSNVSSETINIATHSVDANFSTYQAKGGNYSDWTDVSEPIVFTLADDNTMYDLKIRAKDSTGRVSDEVSLGIYRGDKTALSTVDPHLTESYSPYLVTEQNWSNSGGITIDAGVTVYVSENSQISFYGRVTVNGTKLKPVKFLSNKESPADGDWKFFILGGHYDDNKINYLTVNHVGYILVGQSYSQGHTGSYDIKDSSFYADVTVRTSAPVSMEHTKIECPSHYYDGSPRSGLFLSDVANSFTGDYLDISGCYYGMKIDDDFTTTVSNSSISATSRNINFTGTNNNPQTFQNNYWGYGSNDVTSGNYQDKLNVIDANNVMNWNPYSSTDIAEAGPR